MFGFGYVVCAVVKAAYGDCTIFNFNSCAGEGGSLAKFRAVIVCGVDFNVFGIFGNIEVRRDIIRQDGVTAKGNAGLPMASPSLVNTLPRDSASLATL